MRTLPDANIYVSYLLTPQRRESPIVATVEGAFARSYQVLVPPELLTEMVGAIGETPYLAERIGVPRAEGFVQSLLRVAEHLPPLAEPAPRVTDDPKDDYLLAQARIAGADYLVTGDKHLLALDGRVDPLRIVTPAAFARILAEREQSQQEPTPEPT